MPNKKKIITTQPRRRIQYVCKYCGGTNVTCDALVEWSVPDQEWKIGDVLDNADCADCDGETTLQEVLH